HCCEAVHDLKEGGGRYMKRVLFAASECTPFIKYGMLADVAGSLPQALAGQGMEVSVILPLYKEIIEKGYQPDMEQIISINNTEGWSNEYNYIQNLNER